jgi:hypothetical protein
MGINQGETYPLFVRSSYLDRFEHTSYSQISFERVTSAIISHQVRVDRQNTE